MEDILRICKKCGEVKPLDSFTISKLCSQGRTYTCKSCYNKVFNTSYKKKSALKNHIDHTAKTCKKCGIEKDIELFHVNKQRNDGHSNVCSECQSQYVSDYKQTPSGAKSCKAGHKKYYDNNKQAWVEYRDTPQYQEYRQSDHYKEISETQRIGYYEVNKTKMNKKSVECHLRLKRSNIQVQIRDNLRGRIHSLLRGKKKDGHSIELLGCSIEFLKGYLEGQFVDNMSWSNYGLFGWHIDHIRPCVSFDLTDTEQQKQCFHYTNLQPLWAKDNLSKGSKIKVA
jgi:hypothetical protein